jgi:hypothetical protein
MMYESRFIVKSPQEVEKWCLCYTMVEDVATGNEETLPGKFPTGFV